MQHRNTRDQGGYSWWISSGIDRDELKGYRQVYVRPEEVEEAGCRAKFLSERWLSIQPHDDIHVRKPKS